MTARLSISKPPRQAIPCCEEKDAEIARYEKALREILEIRDGDVVNRIYRMGEIALAALDGT